MILSLTRLPIGITGGLGGGSFKATHPWLIYLDTGISFLPKASPDGSPVQPRFRKPDLACLFPQRLTDPESLKYVEAQAYFSNTEER